MDGEYTAYPESLYHGIATQALAAAKATDVPVARAEHCATALVFASLALETFANRELEAVSPDGTLEAFERLGTTEKWLILPALAGSIESFDQGREPFQTFRALIRIRNGRLVHFKPWKESKYFDRDDPESFEALVQDLRFVERAVEVVHDMIAELWRLCRRTQALPLFLSGTRYVSLRRVESSITISTEHV